MRGKPRVLGVIASSVPGGAEAVFATLLDGLRERFDCYVVCDRIGAMVDRYRASAVDLVATPLDAPTHLGARQVIADAINRWSIDVVHTHLWNADLLGGLAARRTHRPIVSTVHGSNFLPYGARGLHLARRRLLSLTYRGVYRMCDAVLAPSQALVHDLATRQGIRVPLDTLRVVPNGLDIDAARARARDGTLPEIVTKRLPAPLVVSVGNMFAIKGQEWLVRAWPAVLASRADAVLVLVGDGESRATIEALATQLGVGRQVIFTGSLANPLGLVARADVFVMPSLSEGLPIALLEAMALERPIVASRVGGIPEVITDGIHGLLVPPANPEALSQAIVQVLADAARAAHLATAARTHVEREWSSARTVALTAAVYDDVLRRRGWRPQAS